MKQKYLTSVSDFKTIIESKAVYVDKSRYLKAILDFDPESLDQGDDIMLFLRPRRFGKTLTLSMIEHFCRLDYDDPSSQIQSALLFENLKISKDKDFCKKHMAQYPVISLSLKDFTSDNFKGALLELGNTIGFLYRDFESVFLKNAKILSDGEKRYIHNLLDYFEAKNIINLDDSNVLNNIIDILASSLRFLSSVLFKIYGRKCVVLVDEYDVPLQRAAVHGYYEDMVKVIRAMFSQIFKSNEKYVYKAVISGCMRVSKESVFTGVNNLCVLGINDKAFNSFIGFSADEVRTLIGAVRLEPYESQIFAWYDGYNFNGAMMLCPFSVLNFLKDNQHSSSDIKFKNYWANSSSNDIIDRFLSLNDSEATSRLQELIDLKTITINSSESITYSEIFKSSDFDDLMILMMHTGYVTVQKEEAECFYIKIPNKEVFSCFKDRVERIFNKRNEKWFALGQALKTSFFKGDCNQAQTIIKNMLTNFISVRDYGAESNYHVFLVTVLGMFANDDFLVLSNRESGSGYYDITLRDRVLNTDVIIEIKKVAGNATDKAINNAGFKALEQIQSKDYETDARLYGLKVISYSIVFYGKSCKIFAKDMQNSLQLRS